jgi:hypothetical protein
MVTQANEKNIERFTMKFGGARLMKRAIEALLGPTAPLTNIHRRRG